METPFYIRLADLTVEMHNRYPFVRELCRDYTIPAPDTGADICATVSDEALQIVNGDKPILRVDTAGSTVYGTPWAGKEGWQQNRSLPLGAICLLQRGASNEITSVHAGDYIPQLMRQVYLPYEQEAAVKTLDLLDSLCAQTPVYLLRCDMSEEAVKTAFPVLTGEPYSGAPAAYNP